MILDFLASLPPGSVVAQLEDGSIAVCGSLEEADRRIVDSREPWSDPCRRMPACEVSFAK